jgi:hypothetical protein
VNDGWGENPNKPTSGIANWPSSHKKPLVPITTPIATSANSFAQDQQPIEIKSSSLKLLVDEKGKNNLLSNPLALSLPSLSLLTQKQTLRRQKETTGGRFHIWTCTQNCLSIDVFIFIMVILMVCT